MCLFTVPEGATGGVKGTFTDQSGSTSATFTVDCPTVAGFIEPVNQLTILAPYVALVGFFAAATVAVVVFRKKPEM